MLSNLNLKGQENTRLCCKKQCEKIKKPLRDITGLTVTDKKTKDVPEKSKRRASYREEDLSNYVTKLCQTEIKSILRPPNNIPGSNLARPKSANYVQSDNKFKFDIFESKKRSSIQSKDKILKTDKDSLKKTAVKLGPENNLKQCKTLKDKTYDTSSSKRNLTERQINKEIPKITFAKPESSVNIINRYLSSKTAENEQNILRKSRSTSLGSFKDRSHKQLSPTLPNPLTDQCTIISGNEESKLKIPNITPRNSKEPVKLEKEKEKSVVIMSKYLSVRKTENWQDIQIRRRFSFGSSESGNRKLLSPIRPNPSTDACTFISGKLRRPKVEPRNSKERIEKASICCDIFNEEILEDIIKFSKQQEKNMILPKGFLITYKHNLSFRIILVNWMFQVQLRFHLNNSEIYVAISLLDQVLARISVPKNMYQLVALTCIWLANKAIGPDNMSMNILLLVSDKVYSELQLIKMEKKLLKLLDFRIHSIEPSIFINYYLKKMNLDAPMESYFKVFFILDYAIHLTEYSSMLPSLVAAAAISVAFKMFHSNQLTKFMELLKKELTTLDNYECESIKLRILYQMENMKHLDESKVILFKYKDCDWT